MINIICGETDQGKTGKIESIYSQKKEGDGFITIKIFRGPLFCGYEIIRLSTGESSIHSVKSELFPHNSEPLYKCGAYSFHSEGFTFADCVIDEIITRKTEPVFIDEIGPLELAGKGHHDCFQKILQNCDTVYFTVRNRSLEDVIKFFSIQNYSIIRV